MIYSRWRPDTGGYDYFESPGTRFGLGDDLPVPRLTRVSERGACSTDVGRAIPSDARPIGSGPIARGMVAPMGRVQGGVLGAIDFTSGVAQVVIGAVAIGAIWLFVGSKK